MGLEIWLRMESTSSFLQGSRHLRPEIRPSNHKGANSRFSGITPRKEPEVTLLIPQFQQHSPHKSPSRAYKLPEFRNPTRVTRLLSMDNLRAEISAKAHSKLQAFTAKYLLPCPWHCASGRSCSGWYGCVSLGGICDAKAERFPRPRNCRNPHAKIPPK
jgi:hypothetical protein